MNKVLKIGAAGALAFGAVAAHASIAVPSGGSSDAILFAEVLNAAGTVVVASYAGDTGLSISSLLGFTGTKTVLNTDSNLAALFAADTGTDTIQWAVLGGQYTGSATVGNFKIAGNAQFLTTTSSDSTASLAIDTSSSLVKFGGINTDISNINANLQALNGGNPSSATSIEGTSPPSAGIWDVTNTSGLAFWDGGATSNSNALGGTQKLWYVTAGTPAGNTTRVAYTEEATVTLTSGGLTVAGVVPLPAAVWLLGSGLLGLAGVGRRKVKA